jgi:acetylornithine deacetylase/succinyl-diaminopimelate desuccinylase-like protein
MAVRYTSASGSISSSATASFTLWIERFTGPNSATSGHTSMMKRPSEVPPVQLTSGVTPDINCTGGTSDGRFIIDVCPEVAEFGPVNRSIHKVNEAVSIEEIEPLADVYRTAIEALLHGR